MYITEREEFQLLELTSLNFNLPDVPEKTSYVSTASSITYTTDCTHTDGPIAKVNVTSTGKNYDVLT